MRPWLCLSLPNSGSDWFADLVAQCTPRARYYHKEFFNPVTNWPHMAELATVFGCELPSTLNNLYRQMNRMRDDEDQAAMLAVIDKTWGAQQEWNCNKEVWSFGNAEIFKDRFVLWGLTRSADTLFPPSRARVWAWYDVIAYAAGLLSTSTEFDQRCRQAHGFATELLLEDADRHEFPVLEYDKIVSGTPDEVMQEIDKLCVTHSIVDGVDRDLLFRRVFDERRPKRVQTQGKPSASSPS